MHYIKITKLLPIKEKIEIFSRYFLKTIKDSILENNNQVEIINNYYNKFLSQSVKMKDYIDVEIINLEKITFINDIIIYANERGKDYYQNYIFDINLYPQKEGIFPTIFKNSFIIPQIIKDNLNGILFVSFSFVLVYILFTQFSAFDQIKKDILASEDHVGVAKCLSNINDYISYKVIFHPDFDSQENIITPMNPPIQNNGGNVVVPPLIQIGLELILGLPPGALNPIRDQIQWGVGAVIPVLIKYITWKK